MVTTQACATLNCLLEALDDTKEMSKVENKCVTLFFRLERTQLRCEIMREKALNTNDGKSILNRQKIASRERTRR